MEIREILEASLPRYIDIEEIGQGTSGTVFRAWDVYRKMLVAIKVLQAGRNANRFYREFKLLRELHSDSLVLVYDHGCIHGAWLWYSMEYYRRSLCDVIEDHGVDLVCRIRYSEQLLEAIAFLAEYGVAHRDIKPENVFIGPDDQIRVGDFGLAKGYVESYHATPMTRYSGVMGTPFYMAPECWDESIEKDWSKCDQYAVGVIIYLLLSAGKHPLYFGDYSDEWMRRAHVLGDYLSIEVHGRTGRGLSLLDAILGKMLAKDPSDRYTTIAECAREFTVALLHHGIK